MSATIGPVKPYHEMTADELMVEADRIEDSAFDLPSPEFDGDEDTPRGKSIIALHYQRCDTADELRRRAAKMEGQV